MNSVAQMAELWPCFVRMSNRFKITEILADNGASRLARARNQQTGRDEVIRVFKTATYEEWQALDSLMSALASLAHPHIEAVHEVVHGDDQVIVSTDLLEGETISQIVARAPMTAEEFKELARQLLGALSAAHERGIVHGSLNGGRVLIRRQADNKLHAFITGYGMGFGDAGKTGDMSAYLSVPPEQWEQQPARRRSDVYSLGCVLYLALSGRNPFEGKTLKEVRHKHVTHDVRPLEQVAPHAPAWLCNWVMALMEAAPEKRPKDAKDALDLYHRTEIAGTYPPPAAGAAVINKLALTGAYAPVTRAAPYQVPTALTNAVVVQGRPQTMAVSPKPRTPSGRTRPQTGRALAQRPRAPAASASPMRKWLLAAGGVVFLIIAAIFFTRGRKQSPVQVVATVPGKPSPIKVTSNPPTAGQPAGNELPPVQGGYPQGRQKPPAYPLLALHVMAEAGLLGMADSAGKRTAASVGGAIGAWKDYAERARDNTLYHPGQGSAQLTLASLKPDATFPLAKERRFLRFTGEGSPGAALSCSPRNQAGEMPFGKATASAPDRGLTFAIVFFQEVKGHLQTLLHLSSGSGSAVLRLGEKGELRFNVRQNGIPENQQASTLTIPPDKFNPIEPLLVTGVWSAQPAVARLTVRSASGWSHQVGPTRAPVPTDAVGNVLLGREPLPSASNANKNTDMRTLRAFCGGIAEVLLYSGSLKDADLAALEQQLAAHYFPPAK